MYTPAWMSSVHTTARIPPLYVYTTVSRPRIRIAIGMRYCRGSVPARISATGMAVANTRTESAMARVNMKTIEVNRRVARPNRCSRSAYAVTSSPW